MFLMLCVSPCKGQNIQYYQIKNTSLKEYPLFVGWVFILLLFQYNFNVNAFYRDMTKQILASNCINFG